MIFVMALIFLNHINPLISKIIVQTETKLALTLFYEF